MDNNLKLLQLNKLMIESTINNQKIKEILDKMVYSDSKGERELLRLEGIGILIEMLKNDTELMNISKEN